ncbi:MAG: helix-turn-helix domain-containing protein [Acidobacteriota bacterium]
MLDYIATHLFDCTLSIEHIKDILQIRNNSQAIFFHIELGITPRRYIELARLDVAIALLAQEPNARIAAISEHVGYRNVGTFSRAFHRRFGLRPRTARQIHREAAQGTVASSNLLDVVARSQPEVHYDGSVLVHHDSVWPRALTHLLATHQPTDEPARTAAQVGHLAVRLLELGLDPHGTHALIRACAPRFHTEPVLNLSSEPLVETLEEMGIDQGRVWQTVSALIRELDRISWSRYFS